MRNNYGFLELNLKINDGESISVDSLDKASQETIKYLWEHHAIFSNIYVDILKITKLVLLSLHSESFPAIIKVVPSIAGDDDTGYLYLYFIFGDTLVTIRFDDKIISCTFANL